MITSVARVSLKLVTAFVAVLVAFSAASVFVEAQIQPTNSRPNPYQTIENWAKLPEGRMWGSTAGVAIGPNGNIWVAERCGANTCAGSNLAPILEFDPSGKLLTSFGAGMFVFPHGITVDREGNVWVTDADGKDGKGHQVFKFSPAGKVLLTVAKDHAAWKRGIRVGSAKDGSLTAFIPDPNADPNFTGTSAAEGVAADAKGVIYGAEVGPKDLKKYVKR